MATKPTRATKIEAAAQPAPIPSTPEPYHPRDVLPFEGGLLSRRRELATFDDYFGCATTHAAMAHAIAELVELSQNAEWDAESSTVENAAQAIKHHTELSLAYSLEAMRAKDREWSAKVPVGKAKQ